MIATVRIAPVERWCEKSRRKSGHDLAGRQVRIITSSMFYEDCGGKAWLEPHEDSLVRGKEVGDKWPFNGGWYSLCEHMLEMD